MKNKGARFLAYALAAVIVLVLVGMATTSMVGTKAEAEEVLKPKSAEFSFETALEASQGK